jgi:hypothetical protein
MNLPFRRDKPRRRRCPYCGKNVAVDRLGRFIGHGDVTRSGCAGSWEFCRDRWYRPSFCAARDAGARRAPSIQSNDLLDAAGAFLENGFSRGEVGGWVTARSSTNVPAPDA